MYRTISYFGVRVSLEQMASRLFPHLTPTLNKYVCGHSESTQGAYDSFNFCPECGMELIVEKKVIGHIPLYFNEYDIIETDYEDEYMVYMYKHEDDDNPVEYCEPEDITNFINVMKETLNCPIQLSIYSVRTEIDR